MNTNNVTYEDRVNLIILFCLFRANDTENDDRGYAHGDAIQQKLYDGGELDEHERHLLFVAVCNDEEYEEKQASCAHENAWITLYEKYQTTYRLKGGEISETDEDLEPDPLWRVEFTCPDCHLCGYYPDWTNAPEPLRTYCQRCANEQEGNGQKHV